MAKYPSPKESQEVFVALVHPFIGMKQILLDIWHEGSTDYAIPIIYLDTVNLIQHVPVVQGAAPSVLV